MKNLLLSVLSLILIIPSVSLAQEAIVDDAFDPFADYSDFVEASTEETDVNFFKFGRMMSVGAILGLNSFTGELGNIIENDIRYGAFFTFYLGIQSAVQVSYSTATHSSKFEVEEIDESFNGVADHSILSLHFKYFLNTQNFTKAVSKFNPYVIGGFSQIDRTITDFEAASLGGDNSGSFDLGFGAEYIFNNRKNFVSFQLMYYKTDFPNEGDFIPVTQEDGEVFTTDLTMAGDMLTFSLMLGINF